MSVYKYIAILLRNYFESIKNFLTVCASNFFCRACRFSEFSNGIDSTKVYTLQTWQTSFLFYFLQLPIYPSLVCIIICVFSLDSKINVVDNKKVQINTKTHTHKKAVQFHAYVYGGEDLWCWLCKIRWKLSWIIYQDSWLLSGRDFLHSFFFVLFYGGIVGSTFNRFIGRNIYKLFTGSIFH